MLDNPPNQPSKFRTKNPVKINDDAPGTHNIISQIKFKTSILGSSLCDYSDAYILAKEIIVVTKTVAASNNIDEYIIFKNCAPFADCISEINNTEIDHAKYNDVVMPMYNLIEHRDNYLKTPQSLGQNYIDEMEILMVFLIILMLFYLIINKK